MGKQQTARASGGHPAGSSESSVNLQEGPARIDRGGNELPGWFWGMLGCLTVLGVGSTVLFLMFKPPGGTAATATSLTTQPPALRGPEIDIEPIAPPPAFHPAKPVSALAASKPKPAPRPIKNARSPATSSSAAEPGGETDPQAEGDSDHEPQAALKTKAPAADEDNEEAARAHKSPSADDKSHDKPDDKSVDKPDDKPDDKSVDRYKSIEKEFLKEL